MIIRKFVYNSNNSNFLIFLKAHFHMFCVQTALKSFDSVSNRRSKLKIKSQILRKVHKISVLFSKLLLIKILTWITMILITYYFNYIILFIHFLYLLTFYYLNLPTSKIKYMQLKLKFICTLLNKTNIPSIALTSSAIY